MAKSKQGEAAETQGSPTADLSDLVLLAPGPITLHEQPGPSDQLKAVLKPLSPLTLLALTVRTGLRVCRLIPHRVVGPWTVQAVRVGLSLSHDPRRERAAEASTVLKYLRGQLDGFEPDAPSGTVEFQVEDAAVVRMLYLALGCSDDNRAGASRNAATAIADAAKAVEFLDSGRRAFLEAIRADLIAATADGVAGPFDPGEGGPWGSLWPAGRPAWYDPSPLTALDRSEMLELVKHEDKNTPISEVVPPRLASESFPARDGLEGLVARFREFAEAQPWNVGVALERIAAEFGRYDDRRVIDANRASELTGLSRPMLSKMGRGKRMGELRDGQWFFSAKELHEYSTNRPKRGPKPKSRPKDVPPEIK